MIKLKEVDVEIKLEDVIDFIKTYASKEQLQEIAEAVSKRKIKDLSGSQLEGTLVKEMKWELLTLAANKYNIQELEQKLGNKFELI